TPQNDAGRRTEPPVSVPSAARQERAATAAAEPPDDPPGTRVPSHGFRVVPSAEFSVDEPIANSSQLSLPTITAPAARSFAVTVASYAGTNRSRIFEPAVVRRPAVQMTSLSAIGTPASGPGSSPPATRRSISAAAASARSSSSVRYAPTFGSVARARARIAR